MNNLKGFNFNFFIDTLKKYYFFILLFMIISDYLLYLNLGFESSYFTYIIDINFDVDRIVLAMAFPIIFIILIMILIYIFNSILLMLVNGINILLKKCISNSVTLNYNIFISIILFIIIFIVSVSQNIINEFYGTVIVAFISILFILFFKNNLLIILFSLVNIFALFLDNKNQWTDLSKIENNSIKINFIKNNSINLFLNPFLLQTNNYETLLELDKKGIIEKKFNDKNISYLITNINNNKYIRVPIDGEKIESNSTKLMTSKILPLSKNNAIHFIINPKDCNYTNKTCNIVALMTSYHKAGNKEYYKLLTYSIIDGKY